MLDYLRAGDVVIVTRLDRLARNTRDLLNIAEQLREKDAGLRSIAEAWADTTSPVGRMVLTIFAGLAEFERSLILERTSTGRAAALAKGVCFGRRPTLSDEQIGLARKLTAEGQIPAAIGKLLGVHRTTVSRALETHHGADAPW